MAADGNLESFRTPGGHLRITRESVEAARNGNKEKRETGGPSSVLRNRRERVEELALEAQELRAQRDIEKLRREQEEEQAQLEAEAQEQEHQADREAEAARLRLERLQIQQARERQRQQAEQELSAFRSRWLDHAESVLAEFRFSWLSHSQRRNVMSICEAEIGKRHMSDAPRMAAIIERTISATIEPWDRAREIVRLRTDIYRITLLSLPRSATDEERAQAAKLIRLSLEKLPVSSADFELRTAAEGAIATLCQAINKRKLVNEVTDWAVMQLPWEATDADKKSFRRECFEILAELPADISKAEAREQLKELAEETTKEIEVRAAERAREHSKAQLIANGLAEVDSYLYGLKQTGEISTDAYFDSKWREHLKETVQEELQGELNGKESIGEVQELVREIIDEELD